jgi:3-oxoacyl-[acyl-carrier-protein] synthase-3
MRRLEPLEARKADGVSDGLIAGPAASLDRTIEATPGSRNLRTPLTRAAPPVRTAGIVGLGTALPERRVPNAEIAEPLGVSAEWIERRTGIRERRYAAPGQRVSDLASAAARAALQDAGVEGSEIDMVLVATLAADEITPGVAPIVANEIGAPAAAAIDIGAACTGSLAALAHATAWIEAGRARNVLVIGAEILTRMIDYGDRRTEPLFGDGAGALVVSLDADGQIGPFVFGSDGGSAKTIQVTREKNILEMDGHDTFLMAVDRLSRSTLEVLELTGVALGDIDLFVYHQANGRILSAVADRLGVEQKLVFDCIGELGNTSAASVPLALGEATRTGALKPGAQVVLGAIGAGMVWGSTVLTWGGSSDGGSPGAGS